MWEYEVEVEMSDDGDEYEIEVEYDDGYHPSHQHQVNYGGGWGYDAEPEVEIEIEYEAPVNVHTYGGGHGAGFGMGNHMGGFGPGQKHQITMDFNTSGWQSWGSRNQHNQRDWAVPWSGSYAQGGQKHNMHFDNFQIDLSGNIWGHGADGVGQFNISGRMQNNGQFKFNKQYVGQHCVTYKGKRQGAYLSGTWVIPGNCQGQFQIKSNAPRWSGCYWQNGQRTDMFFDMSITNWGVTGQGSDQVGAFNIRGETHGNVVTFAKQYWGQHTVFYQGQWQGNNIKGTWQIPGNCNGKFQMHCG